MVSPIELKKLCKKYFLTFLVNLWVLCCIHSYCGRHSVHRLPVGHPWSFQEDGKKARVDVETPMNNRLQLQEATSKAAFRSWHQDKDANQGELQLIPSARQASLGEWNQSPPPRCTSKPRGFSLPPQLSAHCSHSQVEGIDISRQNDSLSSLHSQEL